MSKIFYIFKLIPIEILLLTNIKKFYNTKSIKSKNFKHIKHPLKCHALWDYFLSSHFQINHFQVNDFVTYFSSDFYFVLHMFCFLDAVDCKWYRVLLHNLGHFLLLVYFLFPMIYNIFISIFQLKDKVGVFYELDNFDLHVIDVTL